jgi:hemerythrin-like domain-containing protein
MAMDVFQMLKDDHQKVKKLIQQVLGQTQMQVEDTNLIQINDMLMLHTRMEEQHLYPVLQKHDELKDLIKDAFEEHQEVKDVLQKLQGGRMETSQIRTHVEKLRELIDHHVQEEENEMFPTAQRILPKEEISRITEQIVQMKERERVSTRKST